MLITCHAAYRTAHRVGPLVSPGLSTKSGPSPRIFAGGYRSQDRKLPNLCATRVLREPGFGAIAGRA
jgi:hypothetical protein